MAKWQDDLFSLALSDGSEQEIFDRVAALVQDLGFDYCAYGLQMPIPVSSPKVFMASMQFCSTKALHPNKRCPILMPSVLASLDRDTTQPSLFLIDPNS